MDSSVVLPMRNSLEAVAHVDTSQSHDHSSDVHSNESDDGMFSYRSIDPTTLAPIATTSVGSGIHDAESLSEAAHSSMRGRVRRDEHDREDEQMSETFGVGSARQMSLPVTIPGHEKDHHHHHHHHHHQRQDKSCKPIPLSPKSPSTKRSAFKGSPSSIDRLARKLGIHR